MTSISLSNHPQRRTHSVRLFLLMLFFAAQLGIGQTNPFRLIYPVDNGRHWVDDIQVLGMTNPQSQVWINGAPVPVDSAGRIDHNITLQAHKNTLTIQVSNRTTRWDTSLTLWRMNFDHFNADSQFVNKNVADSLWLQVLSPRSGEMRRDRISFKGRTHPDATVLLNGDTLQVFPSGGFTGLLELNPGENVFAFIAALDSEILRDTLRIVTPRPEDPEELPLFIEDSALPASHRWVTAGDILQVGFDGRPGQAAYFQIPGSMDWERLIEEAPGQYRGFWRVTPETPQQALKIRYLVKTHRIFSHYAYSNGNIRLLATPLGAITTSGDSRVYHQLGEGLFMPLGEGIALTINGLEDNYFRVWLSDELHGYIHRRNVKLLPQPLTQLPVQVGSLRGTNQGDWQQFRFFVGPVHPAYTLEEVFEPRRLELKLYGAEQGWEWTTFPEPDGDLAYLERKQPASHTWQMNFYARSEQFWGWRGYYDGDYFVVEIRKPPVIKSDSLFKHISIEIDPGHGGYERGAIGVTGYPEADANLRYSLKLAKLLEEVGATVYLTRTTDTRLSLAERAEIARKDSVHIFVMAHNNAPGSGSNPLGVKGTSTYFTWPSAKQICDATYPHLLEMGLEPYGKITRYYYYLLRQTDYLVFLIEGGFMTHPDDEMFLLSEEGLDKLAQAVFNGLQDYLIQQATHQEALETHGIW
ncbi:MAG: N-acetylmuramoyl-L-alanine amidase [Lentisphaeria bacterium]|nr:N-acetylmuramoyl-L-alanine amidase [Candidatus Neomarinimicrobiota bacterium]MCF7842891.1 N-acetylmuramoyl-L-alanine amidase [Lentisphaeria bacterium]